MSIFNFFKRRRRQPAEANEIATDPQLDVAASEAVKALLLTDGEFSNSLDIMRHQLFHRLLADMDLPGGDHAGVMLLSLWANVAGRAMSAKAAFLVSGLSPAHAMDAMESLYAVGLMARGTGRDDVTYYKLSGPGLNAGRHAAHQCLKIVKAVPFD